MNRRKFIKSNALVACALVVSPIISANNFLPDYSTEELIGKAKINLTNNLRPEVAAAFSKLSAEAEKAGFKPHIISAFRSYNHQNSIWERKFKNFRSQGLTVEKTIEKIIEYSTIPGTSRHHWGTDLDIIDGKKGIAKNPLNEKHFNKGGIYHEFKNWLDKNAEGFGFYEVYTNVEGRKGFKYEPWHFSYMPVACPMIREYVTLDIKKILQENKLMGSENFSDEFVSKYINENILDINPALKP